MKKVLLIGAIGIVSVLMSTPLFAQESYSATQTVIFGVDRAAQMVVSSLISAPSTESVVVSTKSQTLQQRLATIPEKITFSQKAAPSAVSYQTVSSRTGTLASVDGASVQTDLRTFLQGKESSPLSTSSLVLTITD